MTAVDAVLEVLRQIASDVALDGSTGTIRDLGRDVPFVRPASITAHPEHAVFLEALEQDPVLGKLFPDDDESRGWIRGVRPSALASRLINGALWHAAMQGQPIVEVVDAWLESSLNSLRGVINGHPLDIPVLVGFGAELPPDTRIETPWGTLRSRQPFDVPVLAACGAEHDPGWGSILESHVTQHEWTVLASDGPGRIVSPSLDDERWQRVALALLLAQTDSPAKPTRPWFLAMMQPLGHGSSSGSFRQFRKGPVFSEPVEVKALERWLKLVKDPQLSAIAINRAISMTSRLTDHVDAFIDAVIVWENIFGTGDVQELGFRVSMTMACVLDTDPENRAGLQQEIKQLYNLRSRVVHGGRPLASNEAQTVRERSQELTVDALRSVLGTHPNVLGASSQNLVRFVLGGGLLA